MGLTLFGVGAGISAWTSVPYNTRQHRLAELHTPVEALQGRHASDPREDGGHPDDGHHGPVHRSRRTGSEIVAVAGDRALHIELDRLRGKLTPMQADAKRGLSFRHGAAAAIIVQTERSLGNESARSTPGK